MTPPMERVTVRIPDDQLEAIEARVEAGDFPNRSEAIRDALDCLINEDRCGCSWEREAASDD